MRIPKHYLKYFYGTSPRISFTMRGTTDRMVYIIDSEKSKDFLWDTDRGMDKVNDCVHVKPISASIKNVATMRSFTIGGVTYQPQGRSEWYFNGSNKVWYHYQWAHCYEYIQKYGRWLPVLYQFVASVYMARKNRQFGPVSLPVYYGYGPQLWAQKIVCAPLPDTAREGTYLSSEWSYILCNYQHKDGMVTEPLAVWTGQGNTLPTGTWVPGTLWNPDNWYWTEEDYVNGLLPDLASQVTALQSFMDWAGRSTSIVGVVHDTNDPDEPDGVFLFDEDMTIINDLPLASRNPRFYWRNWLIQHAYLEACQSVPSLSDNSISNISEIAGFIKSLVVDHKIEFPKRLQDAWLSYRYSYSTTKMDVEDAIKFARRYMSLGSLDREIKCYGVSRTEVSGCEVTCRCSLSIKPKELGYLSKLWRTLTTYGLAPDFYVIWDMIPYSFIVDWLIPVGDLLDVLDASNLYGGEYYSIRDVSFSISYTREMEKYTYKVYSRWASDPLKTFNEFYWLDKPAASSKVKTFRILDTASLFIGR